MAEVLSRRTGSYVYAYLRSKSSQHGEIGTPYYIGKGKHGRGFYARAFDKNHNVHLPADKSNVIILADNMRDTDARQAEILLIYQYGRVDLETGCLLNLTDGGEGCGGRVTTEESRARHSAGQKGKKMPPWTEERRVQASARYSGEGNPFYGKKHSKKSVDQGVASRSASATWHENLKKAMQDRVGIPLTEDHKKKLREARKDRIFSEETRRKIGEAHKGKHYRDDIPDSELIRLYSEGLSCASIASRFDTTRSTVSWRLRKAGVVMRSAGPQKHLNIKESIT